MAARPSDYKRYRADLYYTVPSEGGGKDYFKHSPKVRMKQLLSLPNAKTAIPQALAFAKAHPDIALGKLCVITSFCLKKTDYNYRTDYQWYQWRGPERGFERDEYQKDVHW